MGKNDHTSGRKRRIRLALPFLFAALAAGCNTKFPPDGPDPDPDAGPRCGDGVLDPGEDCDGTDLGGQTCATVAGRDQGELGCTADCFLDISGCHTCPDGVVEGPEECDGNTFPGIDCTQYGFQNPDGLSCTNQCTVDPSTCTAECGNDMAEPGEECDDGNNVDWDGCTGCLITEFRVNTTTAGDQWTASVAVSQDGSFVAAWESNGQDGAGYGIYGQRFDATGMNVGTEFQVNTHTANDQQGASVAVAQDGSFVVLWQSDLQDGDSFGIYGQRFTAQGSVRGTEFGVNTVTADRQDYPSVAMMPDGGFVAVWESWGQDGDIWGIFGRRFDSQNTPDGTDFQVNITTESHQWVPSVAAFQDGTFVVVWESNTGDGDGRAVFARCYDEDGMPVTGEVQVNTYTPGHQQFSSVGGRPDGSFVVVWESWGQDGAGNGIFGQRFSPGCSYEGTEFPVNTYTTSHQQFGSVAAAADGSFMVVWESNGQDGSGTGVFGRRFDAQGLPLGDEFAVNIYTQDSQGWPSVAAAPDGSFVVIWESRGQVPLDWDVFAQRYDPEGNPRGRLP